MSTRRLITVSITALALAFSAAAPAAAAYWNFQGNLAGGNFYVKYTNVSPGNYSPVRMSWTFGSHCMRDLVIFPSGSWYDPIVCGYDAVCTQYYSPYDCYFSFLVDSIYTKLGCYNPAGLATVWVNCRATYPL